MALSPSSCAGMTPATSRGHEHEDFPQGGGRRRSARRGGADRRADGHGPDRTPVRTGCDAHDEPVDLDLYDGAAGTDWGAVWAMAIGTAISPATASTAAAAPTLREVLMFVSSRHRRGHPGT